MESYQRKFAEFIKLCSEAKAGKVDAVVVAYPSVLGDTYEEILESLGRIADAGLSLHMVKRTS